VSDETPTPATPADLDPAVTGPTRDGHYPEIANYRILQKLGEGGMGEVYRADQEKPVRRRVALKVIKRGMDSREVVARFESERQALAMMDHPSIAKVFDAGTTERGRPFFVMEHVKGIPISEYCDTHHLTTPERLELFIQVCEGAQHAHQKGIIHRDLKPSNILVEIQDGRPVPKIIDFGVAKATAQPLTERTLFTQHGQLIGTPEYMSPEQAEMSGLDIDTRTDVYSLGVVLYELLVGALPFDSKQLRKGGFDQLRRRIRQQDPPRPSARITALGEISTTTAQRRRTDVPSLTRQLRGDLDWIVMKALEKDRTRRYASASELAADLRRHLNNEPVSAGPPSALYRLRKFALRHRAAVSAAALVLLALIIGIVGTTVGLMRALRAERRASSEAETARQVSDFLVELFEVSDPEEAQGETITAREILEKGARRIERELRDQPLTRARLMHTIGTVHRRLGMYEEAVPLLEEALEIREELLEGRDPELAASLVSLAGLYHRQGRYEEAVALAKRATALYEAVFGPEHPKVAEALSPLAWAYARQEKRSEAEPLFRRALAIRQSALEPGHPDIAESLNDLGILFWREGRYEEAEPFLQDAVATYERVYGLDDFRVRSTLNNLAVLYWTQGRYGEAEEVFKRTLAIKERVLGPESPEVASTLNNLGVLYDGQGRYAEAEPLLVRALAIHRRTLGPDHDKVGMALGNLAWVYYRQGKYDQAEPLYRQALAIYEASLGADHPSVGILLRDHALLHADRGEFAQAEQMLERSLTIRENAFGDEHPEVAETAYALAELYKRQELFSQAEPFYERALAIRRSKLGVDHPAVEETLSGYADLLRRTGREAAAAVLEGDLRKLP
jgi:serine/threonine protein kinase/Tfp pilus assembly protein PilF